MDVGKRGTLNGTWLVGRRRLPSPSPHFLLVFVSCIKEEVRALGTVKVSIKQEKVFLVFLHIDSSSSFG